MIISNLKKMKWWILALVVGSVVGLINPAGEDSSKPRTTESLENKERSYKGELILIYVGSSQCKFSNLDSVSNYVSNVIARIESQARARDLAFRSVGIAVDTDLNEGINHLGNTGDFDQISVGAGWDNHSLRQYVTDLAGGPLATPQMILVERPAIENETRDVNLYEEKKEEEGIKGSSVVYQAVGVSAIRDWTNNVFGSQFIHNSNWLNEWHHRHSIIDNLGPEWSLGRKELPKPGRSTANQ